MYHILYKITNNITSRFYIGVHTTKILNDDYFGSGLIIRNSIKKYGKENHTKEILEFFDNKTDMYSKEKEIVNENLLKNALCMNLKVGRFWWITRERKRNIFMPC